MKQIDLHEHELKHLIEHGFVIRVRRPPSSSRLA